MSRSIVTIDDLRPEEIELVFSLADEYVRILGEDSTSHRLRGRLEEANGYIASTLFYEPSTRTKFSFEAAMIRLGGQVIGAADPKTTSAAKGETLADTIRVVQSYADVIILRHPKEGAARVAADYASVPIINAGDGSHEHPTQTLCDLYTLRREGKKLSGANVLVCGDLKNGRTVHSLVYALARAGARIILAPAKGLELPAHVANRLKSEYSYIALPKGSNAKHLPDHVDVVYVTPTEPHVNALIPDVVNIDHQTLYRLERTMSRIDVCYVTRFQAERVDDNGTLSDYPVVDQKFLKAQRFTDTQVLHPLPRVGELGYDLDKDPRGVYFKQTAYGVPVRMALISMLLGIRALPNGNAREQQRLIYSQKIGIRCKNPKCISLSETESSYLENKFWIINQDAATEGHDRPLLRCAYCEYDYRPAAIGRISKKVFWSDFRDWQNQDIGDCVMFEDSSQAEKAGFRKRRVPVATD